ncbi:hypothetical protein A6A04_17070 [Paramagnetospirillum marisnigri]|uniref:Agenet-like domain-containing protein n=1 Tax=Paramagnetospirillum marisnigri TaxID=1285242 RepID=A0A178MPS3_9PROT|nr:hypothetical protein [Paramagnetospirillum marisnigri]OAN50812.1 hypothetical protein A6A04_17070 [Paramagnetospirillum marisnigri]
MKAVHFLPALAVTVLLSSAALAQPMSGGAGEAKVSAPAPALAPTVTPSPACVPGGLIEAFSEGAWYPAVALDQLRDGRCFVHYDNYGQDDDEALAPKHVRSRR